MAVFLVGQFHGSSALSLHLQHPPLKGVLMNNDKARTPFYMKWKTFVYPANLLPHFDEDNINHEDRRHYYFICSMIMRMSKKHPSLPTPINWKVFDRAIGPHYRNYIDNLILWNVIECDESYLNDEEHGFCKSYRLSAESRAAKQETISFKIKKKLNLVDRSELNDDVSRYVHDQLNRIGILTDLVPQDNLIDDVEAKDWAPSVFKRQWNVRYGKKVDRMYHALICMPRVSRKNLLFKESPGTQLYDYDIKSCHPVLLLTLSTDPKESDDYKRLLDEDIYNTISREEGITKNRDSVKKDFLMFLNGGIRNYFYRYFQSHFPLLLDTISTKGKSMASWAQNAEAKIMISGIPTELRVERSFSLPLISPQISTNVSTYCQNPQQNDILYIPMHDGWIGIERDEEVIIRLVKEAFYKKTGYWITVTKTNLKTGQKEKTKQEKIDVEIIIRHSSENSAPAISILDYFSDPFAELKAEYEIPPPKIPVTSSIKPKENEREQVRYISELLQHNTFRL
jgi:hypothetical protein